jgi:DNA replication and repair protein RecF
MGFHWIRSFQYRNLANDRVSVDAPRVFLVGENGQGKTNFLEAIYILCYGSSFRTRKDQQLCRHGEDAMGLSGEFTVQSGDAHHIAVQVEGGRKTIRLDDQVVPDRKEIVQNIPCIVFAHQDIQFVQGSPDMQRWFFDQTLSLFDPVFIDTLRRYRRVLKMRNSALKEERPDLVEAYDPQLVGYGCQIQQARRTAVIQFNESFGRIFTEVSGLDDPVTISYFPSWKMEGGSVETRVALQTLRKRAEVDRRLGTTTSGPHRDKFVYSYRDRDFTEIASTGQTRLVSLILRVAQARFFADQAGRRPLLLLDDVLLELDPTRRARFLSVLPKAEQVFFTFLPDEQYPGHIDKETLVYRVENGTLRTAS